MTENSVTMQITAGAGGPDSQDWARMLERMYRQWAQRAGHHVRRMAANGIVSLTITGDFPSVMMNSENGVHRLIRSSPFDGEHRRHTSFAQVSVAGITGEGWPGAIRSYVLSPYTTVHDHRTGLRRKDARRVLRGAVEPFMREWAATPPSTIEGRRAEQQEVMSSVRAPTEEEIELIRRKLRGELE